MYLYLSETGDGGRLLINLQSVAKIESRPDQGVVATRDADYGWEVVVFHSVTNEDKIFVGSREECNQKVAEILSAIAQGHNTFEVFD